MWEWCRTRNTFDGDGIANNLESRYAVPRESNASCSFHREARSAVSWRLPCALYAPIGSPQLGALFINPAARQRAIVHAIRSSPSRPQRNEVLAALLLTIDILCMLNRLSSTVQGKVCQSSSRGRAHSRRAPMSASIDVRGPSEHYGKRTRDDRCTCRFGFSDSNTPPVYAPS